MQDTEQAAPEEKDEIPVESTEQEPAVEAAAEEASQEETASEPVPETPEEELERWRDTAARAVADLDNYRKRMARERSDDLRYARAGLIEQLLPVFDNFSMGLQMAEQDQDSMIYKGMVMVKGQLDDFLSSQGVTEVPTKGEFDPNLHEAIAQEEAEGAEPGAILRVQRKGYRLHDRLLRAAAVVVAKGPEEEPSEEEG